MKSYRNRGGTENETIEILMAISQVSARMARNLSILAARQSEEGGKHYEQNERWDPLR